MDTATAVRKTKLEQELARYVTLLQAAEGVQKVLVMGGDEGETAVFPPGNLAKRRRYL